MFPEKIVLLRRGWIGFPWASRFVAGLRRLCLCAMLACLVYPRPTPGAEVPERKTVVLLYPDARLCPSPSPLNRGIRSTLEPAVASGIDFYTEYLDLGLRGRRPRGPVAHALSPAEVSGPQGRPRHPCRLPRSALLPAASCGALPRCAGHLLRREPRCHQGARSGHRHHRRSVALRVGRDARGRAQGRSGRPAGDRDHGGIGDRS